LFHDSVPDPLSRRHCVGVAARLSELHLQPLEGVFNKFLQILLRLFVKLHNLLDVVALILAVHYHTHDQFNDVQKLIEILVHHQSIEIVVGRLVINDSFQFLPVKILKAINNLFEISG
jgi:hypothetical protein